MTFFKSQAPFLQKWGFFEGEVLYLSSACRTPLNADLSDRLQLFALAYNLGNFLRHLALPKRVREWSLRTLRVKLIKIGAKVIRHSRYVIFQMAEVLVSKRLFQEILERIHRLKPVPIGYD